MNLMRLIGTSLTVPVCTSQIFAERLDVVDFMTCTNRKRYKGKMLNR